MKKVAIITFNRVTNYGSLLQTYALQYTVNRLQAEAEIIDYEPKRLTLRRMVFYRSPHWNKNKLIWLFCYLVSILTKLLAYIIMLRFNRRFFKRTRKYKTYKELRSDVPRADYYMNGSDQLWNSTTNGGINPAYFLKFVPSDKPRISYGASFGKSEFTLRENRIMGNLLKQYSAISVRETDALECLNKMHIEGAVQVLDPTLLLTKEEWLGFASTKYQYKNYLLVYNLNRNQKLKEAAYEIAIRKKLKIVNIAPYLEFMKRAVNLVNVTPNDFVSLFINADYIVTDSFHGIAFAINFGKQFLCMPPPRYSSRLESILQITSLTGRLFTEKVNYSEALAKINYDKAATILEAERDKSMEFIIKALR